MRSKDKKLLKRVTPNNPAAWGPPKVLEQSGLGLEPGRLGLLSLLRRDFDDDLLHEMAAHDGGMLAQKHYEALVEILQTGDVPAPLPMVPGEICNLMKYGDSVLGKSLSPEEQRCHLTTLFACWILLNAYVRPERFQAGVVEEGDPLTLRSFAEATIVLGQQYVQEALICIKWAQEAGATTLTPDLRLFYLLTLLILQCALEDPAQNGPAEATYAKLVFEEQKVRQQAKGVWNPGSTWLFGLYAGYTPADWVQKWVNLSTWVIGQMRRRNADELKPWLLEFQQCLGELLC